MVHSAKLHIEGHNSEEDGIQLLSCDYKFSQETDQRGLTTSKVHGGIINLSFASIEDNEIIQWMITEDADKSGEISFSGDTNSKPFRTIEFKDARLVFYQDNFTDISSMITSLSISVREMTISDINFNNTWMGY